MAALTKLASAGRTDKLAQRKARIAAIHSGTLDNSPEVESARIARLAALDAAIEVVRGHRFPDGWVGNDGQEIIARALEALKGER